jgi:hypothetical protein
VDSELGIYFPEKFANDTANDLNYYSNIKRKMLAELQLLLEPESQTHQKQLQQAYDYFTSLMKPKIFTSSPSNYLVVQEKQFEELVCVLEDNGTMNAKSLTVLEFMKRTEFIEKKFKQPTN